LLFYSKQLVKLARKRAFFMRFAGFTEASRLKLRRIENAKTVTATTEYAA
jgi:hypothetical protein